MIGSSRLKFLAEYGAVRSAEGRGGDDASWYLALPYRDLSGAFDDQWRIRARSWRYLETRILPAFAKQAGRRLRVLDLGAGNCWMAWRLAQLGHSPIAMDIFADARDGLRASRHYRALAPFSVVEAEFDRIPLTAAVADVAIFNASFHYSADYERTLREALRILRPGGAIVIMDTPLYRLPEHGRRMVEERMSRFRQRFGFPSDAQESIEYLDLPALHRLEQQLHLRWTIYKPWYGWRWRLRPWNARLRGKRPPSQFWILVGKVAAA